MSVGALKRHSLGTSLDNENLDDDRTVNGLMRLYDDDGIDITPLPMIMEDAKLKLMEKDTVCLSLKPFFYHAISFCRQMSKMP